MRFHHDRQGICDLCPNPFLYRKAFGEQPYKAGQFGDADNVIIGDVANVGMPVKWKSMVFTQGEKLNGTLDHLDK